MLPLLLIVEHSFPLAKQGIWKRFRRNHLSPFDDVESAANNELQEIDRPHYHLNFQLDFHVRFHLESTQTHHQVHIHLYFYRCKFECTNFLLDTHDLCRG